MEKNAKKYKYSRSFNKKTKEEWYIGICNYQRRWSYIIFAMRVSRKKKGKKCNYNTISKKILN